MAWRFGPREFHNPNLRQFKLQRNENYLVLRTPNRNWKKIEVKGRAPKTGYSRKQFGNGWGKINGCSVREVILARDLTDEKIDEKCRVLSGVLNDPYTGQTIQFQRGEKTSSKVQIDHVVALSDAWQKGAQQISPEEREKLANDPLNLLAVDGPANQAKGDGDAATWLPSNKPFRCQYIARQVAVKRRYRLWVTEAEKSAMSGILEKCVEVN
ncbi:MAG: HNH endonuclease [Candidatus Nanosynbacter sp.]|nr:HNH endonuclease [Candidatus Nanosynbacter sp.]